MRPGTYIRTKEIIKKQSLAHKGHKPSEATRKKLSESHKGNKNCLGHELSEEHKRKISKAMIGNKHLLGHKHSAETKQKIGDANKGSKRSEETRKRMSQAQKGSKNAMFGKHLSPETRKKQSQKLAGPKNPNWKGGQRKTSDGRIIIYLPKHPFVACNNFIRRSRLVMEKKLGRYLEPCEVVHHKNGIVDDDRPNNLQLFPNQSTHTKFHRSS